MPLPFNAIFVVTGEIGLLMTAMRRGARWSSHSSYQDETVDALMKNLLDLKEYLHTVSNISLVEPSVFVGPFLDVIKSEETSGPVTNIALCAINKFISYGMLDPTYNSIPQTVHSIADAVTHAKFVGTDQSSDGVVLMRILQVLRTLTLAPEGSSLTNESLCEIMLSCFRICFETRLNELLRRTAEQYLKDMVLLVFTRLPQFSEDLRGVKHLKMKHDASEQSRTKRRGRNSISKKEKTATDCEETASNLRASQLSITATSTGNIVDMQGSISQSVIQETTPTTELEATTPEEPEEQPKEEVATEESADSYSLASTIPAAAPPVDEFVNERGIRFTPNLQEDETQLVPYGLACVRELFRFLISLCNPIDKQNTEVMIHLGLTLLTVAFEVSAENIGKYSTLLALVKDDLCRNLFSLLNSERLSVFAADLQVAFLMFESLRTHLKFQLEYFLSKLIEIIMKESIKITYEQKEIALDNIVQLWRIPGFVTELYLNYDCDMYCTNLYEDLTKLLAKHTFMATAGVYHTHLLSLDALLTVIESIERHCKQEGKTDDDKLEKQILASGSDDCKEALEKLAKKVEAIALPTRDELIAKKNIKKWLPQGTEHFNHKPKKGIQFLQEHDVLKAEFDVQEVALFLRENPQLDKKMIGEYISNRSNLHVLDAYVKTFDFSEQRIDEALRSYLEAFRLPGEAPTISLLLEHFAEHWHKSNGEPFADVDSAFTLAYAVIMLNVDQHNQNAKKQTVSMSPSAFKKNLKGVNGGSDFDEAMLDEIYNTIKYDEIVMPAEQSGLVRENYLWKVLLRKGALKEGIYMHLNNGMLDSELFQLLYGPIVGALSFVFERSEDQIIYRKVMVGFERCAFVASHFDMTKNLDMLIVTLCKFTMFQSQNRQNNVTVQFGYNHKAQLALRTLTILIHEHGDNIREGWKNLFDLVLALYSHSLLPKMYVEAEDFIETSGKITLVFEDVENSQKQDTGILSSLYSYMVSAENLSKVPSPEEQQYIDLAKNCIRDCNLEQLISDSKFLHEEALMELVKALIELSRGPDVQKTLGYNYNENVTVFFLELLIKIVVQNRDRVMTIWQIVRDHIYTLVMDASVFDYQYLLERAVIGLLRIAIRLMRNEDMSPIVLQSLRMLLLLKSSTLCRISRQISFGLYELLKTSAQNIHTNTDWTIIFTLLECVGAGAQPPKPIVDEANPPTSGTKSDGENQEDEEENAGAERGYTSDSELQTKSPRHVVAAVRPQSPISPNTSGWILVGNEGEIQPVVGRTVPPIQYGISLERHLGPHDASSLIKCCESLAFLVRDVAHITPYNFDVCVHCIRTFVEASLHGCKRRRRRSSAAGRSRRKLRKAGAEGFNSRKSPVKGELEEEEGDTDEEQLPTGYHQISIQLLDLMHTLHTRTAQIFKWWAEEGGVVAQETSLWTQGWCPLLQGIARLCCDIRRRIRMSAITYLQRALLVHDLQTLSGPEWEACFHRVLFPLLQHLLQPINPKDSIAMEETRMRAATVLSKVFLHHLTPLLSLPTFFNLWLIILDFMDKYMHADNSDLLFEAIPESLKNMLLVMDSAKVFDGPDGKSPLWLATWDRIHKFLPNMKDDLFREIYEKENKNLQKEVKVEEINLNVSPVKHNIENATRSSIILQPPMQQQQPSNQVSAHLFAHLGQMVSTPIGSSSEPSTLNKPQTNVLNLTELNTAGVLQPTLQPGMPYMPNFFTPTTNTPPTIGNQQHTFPVLYNNPTIPQTTATEVQPQPVSLYAEYIGNPYNSANNVVVENQIDVNDLNKNVESGNNNAANLFQSSNYFGSENVTSHLIPVGSEILFGSEQLNIPVGVNRNQEPAKTTTDV